MGGKNRSEGETGLKGGGVDKGTCGWEDEEVERREAGAWREGSMRWEGVEGGGYKDGGEKGVEGGGDKEGGEKGR